MKTISGDLQAKGLRVGIAVSRFNDLFTKSLLGAAVDGLSGTAWTRRTSPWSGFPALLSCPWC
jgi:6,7-dimethyl-8-ribityllumazine synthase